MITEGFGVWGQIYGSIEKSGETDAQFINGETYDADGDIWRIARVTDRAQLQSLLDAFGIIVIPDEFGGFEHNTALHLVGRDGRLMLISDIDKAVPFAEAVKAAL